MSVPEENFACTGFSRTEYENRLRSVQSEMRSQGLAGLVVTDPANLYYLTGYNAWSFYTPQMLLVRADGGLDGLVLFAREMDANGAWRTAWLPEEQIAGYPEQYVHQRLVHPFDWVSEEIRRRGLVDLPGGGSGAEVGVEMDSHFFSPKAFRSLQAGLPWTLRDCHELVNWVRVVKSETEIAMMRTASRVTTAAMQVAIDVIAPGVPQNVVAAEIARAQALGGPAVDDAPPAWGDYPAIVPMLPTAESADTPHLTWSDRVLREGDAVVVELAGAHRRYHVPLARTVMLGKPSDELLKLEEAVAEGLDAVLALTKAGTAVVELANAWNSVLAGHGLSKPSRLGYSIGIAYPPDWGERTVSIRSTDFTVLAENMTFHVICGMWMDGFGYEVSEPIRVGAQAVETFTHFPRGLIR